MKCGPVNTFILFRQGITQNNVYVQMFKISDITDISRINYPRITSGMGTMATKIAE